MGKVIGGIVLTIVSIFMLLGFFTASTDEMSPGARGLTFILLVILPALGGGALIYSHIRARGASKQRMEQLRRQTQEAEIVKLAQERGGTLTIADVVAQSGLDADTAEERLLSLMTQGFGDYDLTGSGAIVYSFYDMSSRGDKEANVDHQET